MKDIINQNDDEPIWVSVVVPVINRVRFLKATLESILDQDYPHIECIIVDSGSTDGSLEIARSYGDRVQLYIEPSLGHSGAINYGWKKSKGHVLAWLNADDCWDTPTAVSEVVKFFHKDPALDVAYGQCSMIDVDGNRVGVSHFREWNLEYSLLNCDHCIPQPASFIRKSVLERAGWLDESLYQKKDHELWLRIALIGKIQYFPTLLAHENNFPGLSYDGRTAAPACVEITEGFFRRHDLPDSIKTLKKRAISNAYLRGTQYAWLGGRHMDILVGYTLKAFISDPGNIRQVLGSFFRFMILVLLPVKDAKVEPAKLQNTEAKK